MKKLIIFICLPLSAAFNAGMQWDVRTTGSDSNGGGFDSTVASPGTDFSQQNSAQQAYTDIVVGATTTQGTSALHPFDSTSPGNVINVTAGTGCTVQRVEILSVSGSTATFDKSLGTAASVCTGNLGGSLLSVDLVTKNTAVFISGNTEWIKSGTYSRTTTWIIDTGGATTKFYITGYNTTHGDNGTKPLITTATNNIKLIQIGPTTIFNNLSFSNTASTRADGLWLAGTASIAAYFMNCILDGFVVAINGDNNAGGAGGFLLYNTEVKNSTSDGIRFWFNTFIQGSWIHGNGASGVAGQSTQGNLFTSNSVFSGNTTVGVTLVTNQVLVAYNSVFANNTTDGIGSSNTAAYTQLFNCVIYGNGGWGRNIAITSISDVSFIIGEYNAYGSNTSGNERSTLSQFNEITLTANPFVSSSNFALNSTAGGGAALSKAGFPGVSPAGTGYLDVGAIQTTGGTGGGQIVSVFAQ